MSSLQISLLVFGAIVIAGVMVFNWLQDWQFRRKTQAAFKHPQHEDVLLGARVEPQLVRREEADNAAAKVAEPAPQAATGVADAESVADIDPLLDYVVTIDSPQLVAADERLQQAQQQAAAVGKLAQCFGLNANRGGWEAVSGGASYRKLKTALQIVDRAGPVTAEQLARFGEIWRSFAQLHGTEAECPAPQPVLAAAGELDRYGAEVDIEIGLNVVAPENGTFAATKIRALAESAGFKLEPDGIFYFCDEHGQTLFTMHNQGEPFFAEHMKTLATHGITFLLEVPKVAEGWRVFDRMATLAKNIAASLAGALVDDNGAELNEAGLDLIRAPLRALYAGMDARQISAGSRRAQRLFA